MVLAFTVVKRYGVYKELGKSPNTFSYKHGEVSL